ncbi:phage tailspike protein [Citrobacter braakii]|uniref:phage tailspike protein n=1 Tax=Citrobacter braakii TaxID=57706 RepID=UPI001CC7EFBD|nr:phage tailspike protein [Citrobacter braakii]
MSDITANLVIGMPSQLFTMPRSFKAVANGKIYIGQPDTDPTSPANQIQVYVENESGDLVPVSQPIIINMGGFPVLNGQIKKFVTVQNYTMAIYDSYNAQQFYFEDVAKYDPDQLQQRLASTDAGLGDSLIGVKYPEIGGYPRTQHEKNQDYITPEDFGAIGDGTNHPLSERFLTLSSAQTVYPFVSSLTQTIDYAALQSALNTGMPINIISQLIVSDKITSTNKNVVLTAAGVGHASVKFTTVNGGFDFTLKPQDSTPPQVLTMAGFDIYSDIAVSAPAIKASWGYRQPSASGQCNIENLRIHSGNATTGSFEAGIDLIYCFRRFINKAQILGDNNRSGNDAYRLQGCVEINLTDYMANRYKCPARIKKFTPSDPQTEGIWFNGCWLYDCNMGIYSHDQAIHISIMSTFINPNGTSSSPISNIAAIDVANCSQYNIVGNVLYIGGLSTDGDNQDCIRIDGGGGGVIDSNQLISVMKANTRYGILISGEAIYGKFTNNKISSFTSEGIRISSGSAKGNQISDNYLYDCGLQIGDAGVGNIKFGNIQCAALDSPKPLNPLLINTTGQAGVGKISGDANWGTLIWPNSGSMADLGFCGVDGVVVSSVAVGRAGFKIYTKTALPSPSLWAAGTMGGFIFVTDDVGGFTPAFSDGTNWRRVTDRNVIS